MLVLDHVPDCRVYFQFSASKQVSALRKNDVVGVRAANISFPPILLKKSLLQLKTSGMWETVL